MSDSTEVTVTEKVTGKSSILRGDDGKISGKKLMAWIAFIFSMGSSSAAMWMLTYAKELTVLFFLPGGAFLVAALVLYGILTIQNIQSILVSFKKGA